MELWHNKLAVVTRASSDLGIVLIEGLLRSGLNVVGLADRKDKLTELRKILPEELQSNFHPIKCDISDEISVINTFMWIHENIGGTDLLINNVGSARIGFEKIRMIRSTVAADHAEAIADKSVLSVMYCTREVFSVMMEHNPKGHIIVINSFGPDPESVPESECAPSTSLRAQSKLALSVLVESYRGEFCDARTNIRISSICCNPVEAANTYNASKVLKPIQPKPEDIFSAIVFAITAPQHVQVNEIVVKPSEQFNRNKKV